jgi:DNA polymerase III subunit beta
VKVSCLQDRLAKGLSIVSRAVASRSVLPVLSNIFLGSDDARLKLSATNLEIAINCWIGGRVDEEGSTTVPARLLTEFVNSLPRETKIDMELDVRTQTLNVRCALHDARIKGIDASEFPLIPTGDGNQRIRLDAAAFRRAVEQVLFAAATDESRPILTGVLMTLKGDKLTLAAADGFRLAVRELILEEPAPVSTSIIVPARALSELGRIVGQVEARDHATLDVILTPAQNQILFQMHDADPSVDLVSQLIEGNFPDYHAIIPSGHNTRVTVDTAVFLESVRVAYLFARDSANIVRLTINPGSDLGPGTMQVAATSAEQGDDLSGVQVLVEGEAIEIAFNARYLIDVLSVMDEPEVILETVSASRPGLLRPRGNDSLLCVIMPMHLNR